MSSSELRRHALKPDFLMEVNWCVYKHFKDAADKALTIQIARITGMLNEYWKGTAIIVDDDDVRRALLELQAMDMLRFKWKGDGIILAWRGIFNQIDADFWERAFDGTFGLYSNTPSFDVLQRQLNRFSDNPQRTTLEKLSRRYRGSTSTVLVIMRALQMMRTLSFYDDGAYIYISDVNRERCTHAVYDRTFR